MGSVPEAKIILYTNHGCPCESSFLPLFPLSPPLLH